ncbi:MAG TPA: hypothetical protein VFM99_09725, partial [Chitinophagales bacterium]|nr:hypothetical protein [Chitinophagales bacterium]
KYPHETPYGFCSNNPIIYMDPDGREKIIVIGGGDITGKDPNKFINAGLLQMQNYLEANPNSEPITLVVTDKFVEAKVYEQLQEWAQAKGIAYQVPVTVVKAASGDEVTNYLNSKSTTSGIVNSARQGDQITDLSFFGHGYSFLCSSQGGVDCFEPGHGTEGEGMTANPSTRPEHNKWAWGVEDINKLAYTAFAKNANVDFYNCNPGTPNANGVSLISTMSNKFTSLNISGFWGRSDYAHIYDGMNSIEKFQKWLNGGIFPSKNLPIGGQKSGGAAGTGASEKVQYKGGKSVPSF